MSLPAISLSFTEGRVVRDLFENHLLEYLNDSGYEVLLFTPASSVPWFVDKWSRPGVQIKHLTPHMLSKSETRILNMRRRMLGLGLSVFDFWIKIESSLVPQRNEYSTYLEQGDCRLAVITHPMFHSEMPIHRAAKALKIPTLGILRSWDNLYKGLRIRPDTLAVWNPVNRDEAISLMGYRPENVEMIGGAQFDPYFDPQSVWSREKFAKRMSLDPSRPIITLATLGAFLHLYDETYLVDFILEAIRSSQISDNPQLVIRLHPASKLEHFSSYQGLPDVRISSITGYIPTLGWTMSRADVVFVSNLLRHSDVVVSPGSTITIETAIFDTPTIVPVFHTYQPELGEQQYRFHLGNHFKRLVDFDLVPIIYKPEDLIPAINYALSDPAWYRDQRTELVRDYIYCTDGRSTERLVSLICQMAHTDHNSDQV